MRIVNVTLYNPEDELRICLTGDHGAVPLVSGLVPVGPRNTVSAGGDVFADSGSFLDVIGLPGFGILSCPYGYCDDDPGQECGGGENVLEFETGIRVN